MNSHHDLKQDALKKLDSLSAELKKPIFDFDSAVNIFAYAYTIRVCELAHAMFFLANDKSDAGMFPLLRSMFDPAVRLMYLSSDPDVNFKRLQLSEAKERLRFHERVYEDTDSGSVSDIKNLIEELKAENVKELPNTRQIIDEVCDVNLYRGYSYASTFTHCNVFALEASVFSNKDSDVPVQGNSKLSEKNLRILWMNCRILLDYTEKALHKFTI